MTGSIADVMRRVREGTLWKKGDGGPDPLAETAVRRREALGRIMRSPDGRELAAWLAEMDERDGRNLRRCRPEELDRVQGACARLGEITSEIGAATGRTVKEMAEAQQPPPEKGAEK